MTTDLEGERDRLTASLLELEQDRLKGAVQHLERSVGELKQAIVETGPDQDYNDAINENVVVIAKYRARIAALNDEIKRATKGDISGSQLATTSVKEQHYREWQLWQQQQQRQPDGMAASGTGEAAQQPQGRQQQQQAGSQQFQPMAVQESTTSAMDVDMASTTQDQAAHAADAQSGSRLSSGHIQSLPGHNGHSPGSHASGVWL
eukprot:GHRR01013426.1.p1 GENE.GHRR01013426.1~~GHRR01013426.1.p1  ORF type:complete len:205 (+),score=84.22 GHRR01013426.1:412-1026(+)